MILDVAGFLLALALHRGEGAREEGGRGYIYKD